MKILLTGYRGNLGQSLMRQGKQHQWLTVHRNDWKDLESKLTEVDTVIHAASDLLTPIASAPCAVMDSNIMSTARLLEAMSKTKIPRLIFISSCAVYGRSQITNEEVDASPISSNGLAKLINEKMIVEFCESSDIEYQILRMFNTFGGNDRFSILSHLKTALQKNQPFKMYNSGVSQRDFVHVDDAAALLLKLVEIPVHSSLMNVGSGETTRIADIVDRVRSKYPNLEISHGRRNEAEYSRAEISRLRNIFPDFQFRHVLEFIRDEL